VIGITEKLIIKNGLIFDPINDIEGEVKDILIQDGVIVEKFSSENNVKEINASRKVVIPSALDIHAHFASQQVNWIRLLGTKNPKFQEVWKGLTFEKIARDYISNGYTFILEANIFPSLTKQTIFNFKQIPILDKAMLLNVSNFFPLELEFQKGKIEEMGTFLSDLLKITKGFGIKVYNPFENEEWNFKILREDLSKKGRLYNFSALDVYENLTKANEYLGLPHSIHAHIEGYETEQAKKNLPLILEKINSLALRPNSKSNRSQIFHLAHASSYNIDGDNRELINLINTSEKFDLDIGIIAFNQINPLITSDRRLINQEIDGSIDSNPYKLIRSAVEFEGDSFAMLRVFDKNNKRHCILWANAIDLALNIKNKWKLQLSLNYPNYGDINSIPTIATLLLSNDARNKFMVGMNADKKEYDDNLTFNEYIIISRSSPARSLGLGEIKGNLSVGADGDVNILDINLNEIDVSRDYEIVKNGLKNIEYVIKAGEIIKSHDKIDLNFQGKIFWSEGNSSREDTSLIMTKKKEFYRKYYSIFYDTLKISVDDKYLRKID